MTDVLLTPMTPEALRRYGVWTEEPYAYGHTGREQVARKRFTWSCPVRTVHGDVALTLHYFAASTVEPKRMNDLVYLAEQERGALGILEALVLAATNGIGYVTPPNPEAVVVGPAVGRVRQWVADGGYPEDWEAQLAGTLVEAIRVLAFWTERLHLMQAQPDPERHGWGLVVAIVPPEPTEAS